MSRRGCGYRAPPSASRESLVGEGWPDERAVRRRAGGEASVGLSLGHTEWARRQQDLRRRWGTERSGEPDRTRECNANERRDQGLHAINKGLVELGPSAHSHATGAPGLPSASAHPSPLISVSGPPGSAAVPTRPANPYRPARPAPRNEKRHGLVEVLALARADPQGGPAHPARGVPSRARACHPSPCVFSPLPDRKSVV